MMRHREHEFAMTNEAMLAEFMARVSQVAEVMDQNQPGQPEAAAKLREAVEDLRDVCHPVLMMRRYILQCWLSHSLRVNTSFECMYTCTVLLACGPERSGPYCQSAVWLPGCAYIDCLVLVEVDSGVLLVAENCRT